MTPASDDQEAICLCDYCEGELRFPVRGDGVEVDCPHCNEKTVLRVPRTVATQTPDATPVPQTTSQSSNEEKKKAGTGVAFAMFALWGLLCFLPAVFAVAIQTGDELNRSIPAFLAFPPFVWLLTAVAISALLGKWLFGTWTEAILSTAPAAIVMFEICFLGLARDLVSSTLGSTFLIVVAAVFGFGCLALSHIAKNVWQALAVIGVLFAGALFVNTRQFPLITLNESLFDSNPREPFKTYTFPLDDKGEKLTMSFNRRGGGTMHFSWNDGSHHSAMFKWFRKGNTVYGKISSMSEGRGEDVLKVAANKRFRVEVLKEGRLFFDWE